jgi:Secretion system C-terminal sorting domain
MKKLCVFLTLFFTTTISKAQQAGQLFITSYDDTNQIVYVCDGQARGSIDVRFGMLNINQSVPLTIDSIIPKGNPSTFPFQQSLYTTFVLAGEGVGGDAIFSPSVPGDDTIQETVYYNGQFTATASIVFHARSSFNLAMYGYVSSYAYLYDGNGFGDDDENESTDTMYEPMIATPSPEQYYVGSPPSENGGEYNEPVILRSCGGATIDSIIEVGDFSEFVFDSLPQLPYAMPGDDSLILNFEFTPLIVDSFETHHHYLIFHSTDGHYLTWSLECSVYPSVSLVAENSNASDELKVFPNPATDALQILGRQAGTVHLFDIMGRERMNTNDDGTGATLDVSRLESGIYFLREGNQSTKVEIAR